MGLEQRIRRLESSGRDRAASAVAWPFYCRGRGEEVSPSKEERPEYHALLEEELETLSIETRRVGTSTASGTRRSLCPLCGRGSSLLVHSRYSRTGSELPWRATPGYTF